MRRGAEDHAARTTARSQHTASIEATRKQWRDLAANPQTRASLASACKQAVEPARAAYKSYGCEF